ncbi:MFS transporter [Streptomyces sp. NPDC002514]|uniref:MFS transporter n=1 Tax=unclassified Streptomyces TaxID=2593676 RepID=UPI0036997635
MTRSVQRPLPDAAADPVPGAPGAATAPANPAPPNPGPPALRKRGTAGTGNSPRTASLMLPASIVVSFLAASSAPTPLYATYAGRWGFSPITTTVVFGVYAIAVLLALLVLGRLSDHVGRRPVLLAALAVQMVALAVLITADGVGALVAGRVLQGVSTGGALGALGAVMVDIDRRRGTTANAAAPGFGTGTGALLSGLLVQYAPAPTRLVYLVLVGVFVVQAFGVFLMPETVTRKPGARAALVPEFTVPAGLRGPVVAAAPILFAVWALAGFYGSLGPALVKQLSGSSSVVLGGFGFFLLAVVGSLTTGALGRVAPRTVMLVGIVMLVLAAGGTVVAVGQSSAVGFFGCTVVAGIGFGAGFQGGMRTVVPLAAPHERAGVLSVVYVVCYLGMGAPSVAAGFLVVHGGGLIGTARDYEFFVLVLALAALLGLLSTNRSGGPRAQGAGARGTTRATPTDPRSTSDPGERPS